MAKASAAEVRRIERALLRRLPESALQDFLDQERSRQDMAQVNGDRVSYDWHHAALCMVRGILEERERPFPRVEEQDSYSDLTVDLVPDAPAHFGCGYCAPQPCTCGGLQGRAATAPCRGCSRPSTHTKHDGREDVPVCDDCIFTR